MYLSRIQLTDAISSHSQLGLLLKDRSYGMHRLLWDLFDKRERFLFREESSREQLCTPRNLPLYYVLSNAAPLTDSPIFLIETKSYEPLLKTGDSLSFKLRANPTVARRKERDKNSKRHDVIMDAQRQLLLAACKERQLTNEMGVKSELRGLLLKHPDYQGKNGRNKLEAQLANAMEDAAVTWLKKRGSAHGFELNSVQATGYRWNALPEKGRNAGFSSMDYEGVLTVTEPDKLLQCLARGLGPSKAFGCGLMLIRRI